MYKSVIDFIEVGKDKTVNWYARFQDIFFGTVLFSGGVAVSLFGLIALFTIGYTVGIAMIVAGGALFSVLLVARKKQRYSILLLIGLSLIFSISCNQTAVSSFSQENDKPHLLHHTDPALLEQYQTDDSLLVLYLQEIQHEVMRRERLLAQQAQNIITLYRVIFVACIIITLLTYIYFLQRRKTQDQTHIVQQYEAYLKQKKETQKENGNSKMHCTLAKLVSDLQHLFETEKTYRQQGLSVDDVVQKLQTNSKYLSNAINRHFQKNFTEFVNTYRVEEAIEILKEQNESGEYAHYTIQAIAETVGFNGRTAFYAAFKKIVGLTPTEYMGVINQQKDAKEDANDKVSV